MPANKKSTAALAASGAFSKNPGRAKLRGTDAVNDDPLGECPVEYLNELEQKCWHQIVENAAPGVLKRSDSLFVENYARVQALLRMGAGTAALLSQAAQYQDRIAGNPKARPNVQIPKAAAANPFSTL